MAYTDWEVVAFEQPTAAKWNQLGENDAGFKDGTNFDDDIIGTRHIDWDDGIWWEELGRTTLGSTGTSVSVSGFAAKKYLAFFMDIRPTGGTLNVGIRFNGDSGNNYADRSSNNGGADATGVSQANIFTKTAVDANPQFIKGEILNIATLAKLCNFQSSIRGSSGAGNAPDRKEGMGKWENTSAQITRIDAVDIGGTGDIAAGSEIVVLGHD